MKVGNVYCYDNTSVEGCNLKLFERIIAFDDFEVFSEYKRSGSEEWDLSNLGRRKGFSYFRNSRMNFEQFSEYLGFESFPIEVGKILFSDLLLRIGRIRDISWGDEVFENRLSIEEYLDKKVDRRITDKKLMVASIYLKGINKNGYPSKPELLHAENGCFFTLSELMVAANRIQTSIKLNKGLISDGVGIYRDNEVKNGLPVYYIWGYYDLARVMKKYEESGIDISLA